LLQIIVQYQILICRYHTFDFLRHKFFENYFFCNRSHFISFEKKKLTSKTKDYLLQVRLYRILSY